MKRKWILSVGCMFTLVALTAWTYRSYHADSSLAGRNDRVKISNGKTSVSVDLKVGGRIMEYSKDGNNVIFVRGDSLKHSDPDGGRCDFGPERIVPRHPETWLGEWELLEKDNYYVKIKSQVAKNAGVQLIREFTLDKSTSHLKFKQTIVNVSASAKRYCHWGRTFIETFGICLAPLNPNSRFPMGYMIYKGNQLDFSPKNAKNILVRDGVLEISGPPENPKIITDGSEGWLACITQDNQLFIKKFEVYPEKIYGEMTGATVCVWYNNEGICEVEPIGPWEWIQPGDSISFTEHWYLLDYAYPKNKMADLKEIRMIIEKLPPVSD